jgi:hypothetical protein
MYSEVLRPDSRFKVLYSLGRDDNSCFQTGSAVGYVFWGPSSRFEVQSVVFPRQGWQFVLPDWVRSRVCNLRSFVQIRGVKCCIPWRPFFIVLRQIQKCDFGAQPTYWNNDRLYKHVCLGPGRCCHFGRFSNKDFYYIYFLYTSKKHLFLLSRLRIWAAPF